jgi:hypothetical protein
MGASFEDLVETDILVKTNLKSELSFVILIRLKRIYYFLCYMLIYTPFALCFVTLYRVFMHF